MLRDNINNLISESMKAHDSIRTNTLRLIKDTLLEAERDYPLYTEELETKVLFKMVLEHKDSIHCFEDRKDLQAKEQAELDIILEFAPKEASEEDVINKTKEIIAYRSSCIGKVTVKDIKDILTEVRITYPTASGALVSSIVRNLRRPNDAQKEIISRILGIVKVWENTNDINSPSHPTLIEEELRDLDLPPSDIAHLTQALNDLWWIVQYFNI